MKAAVALIFAMLAPCALAHPGHGAAGHFEAGALALFALLIAMMAIAASIQYVTAKVRA